MNEGELDRLRQGVDRIEIHELLNRYAHAIDFMDWPLLEQVFTEDDCAKLSNLRPEVAGSETVQRPHPGRSEHHPQHCPEEQGA